MHAALQVTGIEVIRFYPRSQLHVLILGPQLRRHHRGADAVHMPEHPHQDIRDQVGAQGPAGAEVAEHPGQVGDTGEHDAVPGYRVCKIHRFAVHVEGDPAQYQQLEAGRGNDQVRLQFLAGFQQYAFFGKGVDFVGHHAGQALPQPGEQVSIRNDRYPLLPGAIAGREMLVDVKIFPQELPGRGQ